MASTGNPLKFGWEIAKDDQERLDFIFQGTMANYGRIGYLLGEIHPKAVTDPATSRKAS